MGDVSRPRFFRYYGRSVDIILVYLIGCLLGFGLTYSVIVPYAINEVPRLNMYIYGTFCSWLTVALFLLGLIMGILKGVGNAD